MIAIFWNSACNEPSVSLLLAENPGLEDQSTLGFQYPRVAKNRPLEGQLKEDIKQATKLLLSFS